jgi:hypothetical protein
MPETRDARERRARRSAEAQGLRIRKLPRSSGWEGYVLMADEDSVLCVSSALEHVERYAGLRRDGFELVPAPLDGLRVHFQVQASGGFGAPVAGWMVLADGAWIPLVPLGDALGPNPLEARECYARDRLLGREETYGDLLEPAEVEGRP